MQTFLPYPSFEESAKVLDYRRLGKQRAEAKQVYEALTNPEYGWKHHSAVRMWRNTAKPHHLNPTLDTLPALAHYGLVICKEWISRGYEDSTLPWFRDALDRSQTPWRICRPFWIGDPEFHRSHQSNLIRKNPEFYRNIFPGVPDDLPYVWPS